MPTVSDAHRGNAPRLRSRSACAASTRSNLLSRYSVLTTWHFPALLGGNSHNWQERLRLLFDGGFVERPVQLKRHFNAMNRPRGYKATPQGLRAVGKSVADLPRGSGSPPHDLMASDLMASFEIGAKENGIRFITWQELLNSRSMPEATRNLPKPWAIPVPYQGKTYSVEADAEPFGLQITRDGRNTYYFCLIEADMNTMGLESATFERSSIVKKFTLYLEREVARPLQAAFRRQHGRAVLYHRPRPPQENAILARQNLRRHRFQDYSLW